MMSMIGAQLKGLGDLQEKITLASNNDFVRMSKADADVVRDAIDTIRVQSAKLMTNNLHSGWISCEEQLPKECEKVVICDNLNRMRVAIYRRFSDGSLMFCADIPYMVSSVKCWMELPELPEMGGTE